MSPARANLGMDWDYVNMIGSQGQYNLTFLRHMLAWIRRNHRFIATVDVTCLIAGSNDILEFYNNRPDQLAQDIIQAAENLITAGSRRVDRKSVV